MSAPQSAQQTLTPSKNRPPKARGRDGKASHRALRTWRDAFSGFVHSSPDANLPTSNPAPQPNRNTFSLGSGLRRKPALALNIIPDYETDGQLSFETLRNYSATVYAISQDRVSHDAFALIEHQ